MSNYIVLWFIWNFLLHDAENKIVIDIESQSWILSNLFIDFSDFNFLYVNLELDVSKLS
jgi:hypothetical protein